MTPEKPQNQREKIQSLSKREVNMDTTNLPKAIARIKFRARYIEFLHWKKLGLRLLWRAILLNCRIGSRKIKCLTGRK